MEKEFKEKEGHEKMKDKWESQSRIVHCPRDYCGGMLLQNPFRHEEKCSHCKRYFIERTEYKEVIFNIKED